MASPQIFEDLSSGFSILLQKKSEHTFLCYPLFQDYLNLLTLDVHNLTTRKPLIGKCAKYVEKVMGEEYMKKIFIDNPFEIIK